MSQPPHDQLADRALILPHAERLDPTDPHYDEIIAAHRRALDEDAPGYLDPVSGLFVLSAAYLATRGTCCSRGCRHCPYLA